MTAAVVAAVRHQHTDYDNLLANGVDRTPGASESPQPSPASWRLGVVGKGATIRESRPAKETRPELSTPSHFAESVQIQAICWQTHDAGCSQHQVFLGRILSSKRDQPGYGQIRLRANWRSVSLVENHIPIHWAPTRGCLRFTFAIPIYCIYLRCKSAYRKGFARPRLSTGQALTCYRGCLLDRRTQEATEEEKR